MSANSLPRPSRPSIAPPTGPLPSLPVAKTRHSNIGAGQRIPSTSLLPSPAVASRAVSSSALSYRPGSKHGNSPSVPTLTAEGTPVGSIPQGKTLRKTVSIGAFPRPPSHTGKSAPNSPLSTSSMPGGEMVDRRLSIVSKASVPSRNSSLKKPRNSNIGVGGGRGLLPRSPLSPPSFLNGSADSVAVDTSHLSLPSPPQSRNSSPQGSYTTSATTFEDVDDESRGRADNKDGSKSLPKDGKGNVLVSVRVRPDAGPKDGKTDMEWDVDNKQASIAYKGREGGDYTYGKVPQCYASWKITN
jgi:centromeric protein E